MLPARRGGPLFTRQSIVRCTSRTRPLIRAPRTCLASNRSTGYWTVFNIFNVVEHYLGTAVAPLHERFRRRTKYRFRVELQRADDCED